MSRRQPEGPPPPPIVQRVRIRYAKRGRLRFSSHRDFARAFERALRRAEVPMAYSAGFHPHPKISYVGAAPTGVGSEAEYLEIALAKSVDLELLRQSLDSVLPDGLDLVSAVDVASCAPGSLAEQIQASKWLLEFHPGTVVEADLRVAVADFLAREEVLVDRLTKDGKRSLDARGAVVSAEVRILGGTETTEDTGPEGRDSGNDGGRAILEVVVRQVTPTVRPDDLLSALTSVTGFAPSQPPRATRLAQGPIDEAGVVSDPLRSTDRAHDPAPVGTR
ncbi:TIGR03936 family radical SAM-associated protein [Jatrophihabitans telluris]|uniref:TIGR03936 family radical SAM-associated protein n=1 Tax=Jatrophihabitans telluris TaxID=2038343 RepID=A0ABY4R2G5_9ACTN|nr:TIGR03936 family radical SAM-associated protein [Jatrophihabitans telluris]UQX89677.1 TIGR03936 family radical SAM-associated protein [Jatrophihabitans telluris]